MHKLFHLDTFRSTYRRQPGELERLIPWLNREVQVLLTISRSSNAVNSHIAFVMSKIMDALRQYDIRSAEFRGVVWPFFTLQTDHFIHELLNFARTNFDIIGYDQAVTYLPHGSYSFTQHHLHFAI